MVSNTLIFIILRPVLRFLTVPYEAIVPEHTRYALFQLYCDLRANPPRDRHWFMLHARRLRPQTFSGWIALSSALLYMGSGAALLMTSLLSFAVVALYGVMFATVSVALVGGFMLGLLAFSLFITSGAAFFGATGAAVGYSTLAAGKAALRLLPIFGSKPDPFGAHGLPEPPRLRPVATPRAPVSTASASPGVNTSVAAVAPVTALPPDPAPASPCRRHPTPTSEAFQRGEVPAAASAAPAEPSPAHVNGLATGPLSPPRMDVVVPQPNLRPLAAPAHAAVEEPSVVHHPPQAGPGHSANGEAHAKSGHHKARTEAATDAKGAGGGTLKGHTSPKAALKEAAKAAAGGPTAASDKENLIGGNAADRAADKGGNAHGALGRTLGVS
ncbi:hypothetical protein WJX81_008675 [Elliptochloris bilobata]|uniref:Uncharacterized protein n=1 Tax=Elliptochloris bilobata TaxID=381761 RepID=A0AAW1RY12_9CHLO